MCRTENKTWILKLKVYKQEVFCHQLKARTGTSLDLNVELPANSRNKQKDNQTADNIDNPAVKLPWPVCMWNLSPTASGCLSGRPDI